MRRRPPPGRAGVPFRTAVLLAGLAVLAPQSVRAQTAGGCDVPNHLGLVVVSLSNGSRISYLSSPTLLCPGNTRIQADSAVVYEATNYTQLFQHVVFQDADSRLTADQAHYFGDERRLRAWGQVVLNDLTEGSIIRGDTMVLLRAGPDREEDQLTVGGLRPHATLYPTRQPLPPETPPEVGPDAPGGAVPSDSAAVFPDSAVVFPDSAAALPDTAAAPPDTVPGAPEPAPATQAERVPYEIRARRMFLDGSKYFRAVGGVTIDRDSVHAVADSVEYDQSAGALFLARAASLTTSAYKLSGETIRLDIPQDEIRSVLAREDALLEGEELWLLAPQISLVLSEGRVDRLIAVQGPPEDSIPDPTRPRRPVPVEVQEMGLDRFPQRPHAFAQDFLLWADSIEVRAPDEVLDQVWAMGRAHGESTGRDSLNAPGTDPVTQRDWLEGDTIVAIFVPNADSAAADPEGTEILQSGPPAPTDSAGAPEVQADSARYRLDRLVARVNARSLYRLAPTDSTLAEGDGRLAIHYVLGAEITIVMSEGEVDRMEVSGDTRGIHLEPVAVRRRGPPPDTTIVRPDTTVLVPDTTQVRPDTAAVPPDTMGVSIGRLFPPGRGRRGGRR